MAFLDGIDDNYISAIIDSLCDGYESLWFVDASDLSLRNLKSSDKIIPGSVATASQMTYEEARLWYIDNYITDDDKEHVRAESQTDIVLSNVAASHTYTVNYKRINHDAINYNQLVYSNIDLGDDSKYFLLGFRDIDRRNTAEIDGITGLYNRIGFLLHAKKMIENNPDKHYDLMMSDFVDFKRINEVYGSKMGDRILSTFGAFLVEQNIENRSVVGRFGGDQFVELVEHSLLEERILNGTSPTDILDESFPTVNVKFGIYRDVDHDLPVSVMCDRAGMALKTIKDNYGVFVAVFNNVIKDRVEKQRIIENSMYDALISDQFKVFYQPKHDTTTGKIVGAEALIRWIHPEYGFMSPGDFIPIFEKNGFVSEADKYVLETTCKNIRRWQDMGIDVVPISVNASRCDFLNIDMVKRFNDAVNANDISKDLIHIEITESLMEENTMVLIEKLNKLREEGYQIELDDFGSGYSSINALSEFPIDIVKLDMSFMKKLDDAKKTKVLSSCIDLAKNLGYKTVSEGVETKQQQELLLEYGVDAIQGYYYSKPLPAEEFEKYIVEGLAS